MSLLSTSLLQPLCLIDGRWQAALDAAVFDVDDPATGQVIAQVANGGVPEVRAAIAAAERALPAWRAKPARERAQVLRRWYELILEHADELAGILTTEQGKPLAEAKGEVLYGASFVEWFAEQGRRIMGDIMESPQADKRLLVLRQGIGVCAAITPWNFPNAMARGLQYCPLQC